MTETPENNKPNNMFFEDRTGIKESKPEQKQSYENEFVSKGTNRKLNEKWNIHFTISSGAFSNLTTFINEINYDVLVLFKKKEMVLMVIDSSGTHASSIHFEKTEFADYDVRGLENDGDEMFVFMDFSVIIDDLSIDEKYPIDFYIDTLDKNRFYVISGKEIVAKQLQLMNVGGDNAIIIKHKNMDATFGRITKTEDYQKMVVNQNSLTGLFKSLSKKMSKKKDETTIASLYLKKNELDFRLDNSTRSSSVMLLGEDLMVYPLREDSVKFNLEFFNKFSKLKTTYTVSMWIANAKPVIFEARLGGGRIIVNYLLAPRVDESN